MSERPAPAPAPAPDLQTLRALRALWLSEAPDAAVRAALDAAGIPWLTTLRALDRMILKARVVSNQRP